MTQQPLHRCDRCGKQITVIPESPYEFRWTCPGCNGGLISWGHDNPPPTFQALTEEQLELPTGKDLLPADAEGSR